MLKDVWLYQNTLAFYQRYILGGKCEVSFSLNKNSIFSENITHVRGRGRICSRLKGKSVIQSLRAFFVLSVRGKRNFFISETKTEQ